MREGGVTISIHPHRKEIKMCESTTITLSKSKSISDQISEVNDQILEWIESFERPYNDKKDVLTMEEYKRDDKEDILQYAIECDVRIEKK